jgi:hypothetical protein
MLVRCRCEFAAAAALAVLFNAGSGATTRNDPAALPAGLESYLSSVVRLTTAERKRLIDGAPMTKLLDTDVDNEVAVVGAVWISAPMRKYVTAVNDIETFERGGGFKVTRRISAPPRLEDFADLRLPEEDVAALRTCRIGNCKLKLGERAIQAFRTKVDWNAADSQSAADAVMQEIAYEYATGYLEGGNDGLAVHRDHAQPVFVASELRSMIDQMPTLTTSIPDLRRYLLDFPKATLPDVTSFLYWQEAQFGLKPTIRISHVVIQEGPDDTVVASKMLYASHYFWTALELRVLLPDPSRGHGFWFVTLNRSRSDGLTGFTGFFVRSRVRGEVQRGALTALASTKSRLEHAR